MLKTLKENLHHKTEANGVFTNIKNLTELKIKYNDIKNQIKLINSKSNNQLSSIINKEKWEQEFENLNLIK